MIKNIYFFKTQIFRLSTGVKQAFPCVRGYFCLSCIFCSTSAATVRQTGGEDGLFPRLLHRGCSGSTSVIRWHVQSIPSFAIPSTEPASDCKMWMTQLPSDPVGSQCPVWEPRAVCGYCARGQSKLDVRSV